MHQYTNMYHDSGCRVEIPLKTTANVYVYNRSKSSGSVTGETFHWISRPEAELAAGENWDKAYHVCVFNKRGDKTELNLLFEVYKARYELVKATIRTMNDWYY